MSSKFAARDRSSHSHNLSINSISSLSEPSTPPATNAKSGLWNGNKLSDELVLPTFDLNPSLELAHTRKFSNDSVVSDKENQQSADTQAKAKIDKSYLASLAKTPLAQLSGEILRLAKDQHGCRFLQKRIDEHTVPNIETREANFRAIFAQIEGSFYELIIDPFGNYLIQKLIQFCFEDNLDSILASLSSNLFSISINQHGTRALQKIIDKIDTPRQYALLVQGLKPYIIELIKDLNGNHVIQRVLNKYTTEECQFVYDAILADLLVVATHKHGCCVLQKCLNHVNESQHASFARVILCFDNFVRLVNDQFGNYVLQYIISVDSVEVNQQLYRNFVKVGVEDLCVLKFSSNVIEKLMKNCFTNEPASVAFSDLKFIILGHILTCDMNKLVNDPYGNYVVQTLIDILINPAGTSFITTNSGERVLLPSLRMLLEPDYHLSSEPLQVQIIKNWFANCRIVSSFGKRIQSKINSIINGSRTCNRRFSADFAGPRSFSNGQVPFQRSLSYTKQSSAPQYYRNEHVQAVSLEGHPQYPSNYHKHTNSLGNCARYGQNYTAGPREYYKKPSGGKPSIMAPPPLHTQNHPGAVMPYDVSYRNVPHYGQNTHFNSEDLVDQMGNLQLDNPKARSYNYNGGSGNSCNSTSYNPGNCHGGFNHGSGHNPSGYGTGGNYSAGGNFSTGNNYTAGNNYTTTGNSYTTGNNYTSSSSSSRSSSYSPGYRYRLDFPAGPVLSAQANSFHGQIQ